MGDRRRRRLFLEHAQNLLHALVHLMMNRFFLVR